MPVQSRIPRSIDSFSTYITNTNTYMLAGTPTNWSRLGWLQAEMTQWTSFVTQNAPLYAKYSDKKGGRTTAVIEQLHLIIKQCTTLNNNNHLLDRIAAAPTVSIIDMQTFHINKGVLQASARTNVQAGIAETVTAALVPIGGGDVQMKCRTTHDSKRPSIPDDADSVQYAYQAGGTAPVSADDASLKKDMSTRAAFTLHTGPGNAAKSLYIFFRWYNSKHPDLAGPWSAIQTTVIV